MYNLKNRLAQYHQRTAEANDDGGELIIKVLERMGTKVNLIVAAQEKKDFSEVQKHVDHFNDLYKALLTGLEHDVDAGDQTSKAVWEYLNRMFAAVTRLIKTKNKAEGERIAASFMRIAEVIKGKLAEEKTKKSDVDRSENPDMILDAYSKGDENAHVKMSFSV